jgi:acetyltransferase-like isoleucine patch superfamily enzyme
MSGMHVGKGIVLNGKPLVEISNGGEIWLEDEVVLNSSNRVYHINMHSPVKLFADRPGAVIRIGERTRIHGSCIHAYERIEIGKRCLVAANCQIIDGSGHDLSFDDVDRRLDTRGGAKPVVVEDAVWIAANCIILPGSRIGRGSVIAAGSVVTGDIPPMVLAGGNPAKVVRDYRGNKGLET